MVLFLTAASLVWVSPIRLGQPRFYVVLVVQEKQGHGKLVHLWKLQGKPQRAQPAV